MRKKALLEIRIKKSSLHVPLSLSQPFPDKTVTPPPVLLIGNYSVKLGFGLIQLVNGLQTLE